ncbi:Cellulose synthase-like protein G2 [Camellia lanceoleosa]|nr:Cellulose synthase-like protein G2 [Camellia lanceoleosa]
MDVSGMAELTMIISYLFHHAHEIPIFSWCLITTSELLFTFIWIIAQAFWWQLVTYTVHPKNLPGNTELPGIDVFICTADPKKEPTVEVIHTVLSAVALDYPLEKLAVYLSDDDGWPLTLYGLKKAYLFGRSWISFSLNDLICIMQSKYEVFKKNVEKFSGGSGTEDFMVHDRPPHVELRITGIMSNGPYVLVLDCDMFCNDPTSARQSMCFHLDLEISRSLAFVQFPQIFYNVSKNDIYDGQARSAYKTMWQGMDGLRDPPCSGTGYYLKRKTLFGSPNPEGLLSNIVSEEARNLASCTFENGTKWGKEIGYSYDSLLESTFTRYLLHSKGWRSIYLYPKRPCFLGCTTIDMKDTMVQQMKWSSRLLQVGLSKFSPLTYGMSRMSMLQSMCYGNLTFTYLQSFAFLLYGTIPQLCLLNGIPLYPKISNPWFVAFASVYTSALCQHLYEVLSSGGSIGTWWNEQRIGKKKFWVGITKASFRLTNKAIDQEKLKKYEKGKFDFKGAAIFMVPLTILVILNIVYFIGGAKMVITERNFGEMFGQIFLSSLILVLSYPILEGLIQRKSK